MGKKLVINSLIALLVIDPMVAMASEASEHHAQVGDLFFPAANFIMFCLLMYYLLRGGVRQGLLARRDSFQSALDKASKVYQDAENQLAVLEKQQAAFGQLIDSLKANIVAETKQEAESIIAEAEEKARRAVERASETAAAEVKAVQELLRQELVTMVMTLAESQLKSELDRDGDRILRSRGIDTVINQKLLQTDETHG